MPIYYIMCLEFRLGVLAYLLVGEERFSDLLHHPIAGINSNKYLRNQIFFDRPIRFDVKNFKDRYTGFENDLEVIMDMVVKESNTMNS